MSAFDPAIFHVKRIFLNKREDNVPFEGAFEKKKRVCKRAAGNGV